MRLIGALLCMVALLLPALCPASTSHIRDAGPSSTVLSPRHSRANWIFWFDDVESGEGGWTHGDLTADIEPRFHVDSYQAYPDGSYSYWCGMLDPAFSGGDGYGNEWDQRLELPPIHLGGTSVEEMSWGGIKAMFRTDADPVRDGAQRDPTLPMLTFTYRHDSEIGYDYTCVQVESTGTWIDLNSGYSGSSGGWQDCGSSGFSLSGFGDPVRVRFRFKSDGAWSDEDGLYDSDGGAFHVDNIRVFDFASGEVYFYDDCEDGAGLCEPTVPAAAGDWWHIIDRECPAVSDPHSWWCGDDADTSHVPPGLHNELCTPLVGLGAWSCTVHFAIHFAVPTVDNDHVEYLGTCDGENYYSFGAYWGDFGQCDGWSSSPYMTGFDVGQFSPPGLVEAAGFKFIFHTTDNGCGPGAAGDAGVMIDDIWMEGCL
ncbi:hypothetical protein KAT82_04360 [bacterium]|nr:hypothetical protein [bacterium]